jgi:hypothetical protein
MRQETCQKSELATPQEMTYPVKPQGMQSGIAEDNLQHASGGGVFIKDSLNVFPQGIKQV